MGECLERGVADTKGVGCANVKVCIESDPVGVQGVSMIEE